MKLTKLLLRLAFVFAASSIFLISSLIFTIVNPYTRNGIKVAFLMPEFIQKHEYAGWQKVLKFHPLQKLTIAPTVTTVTIDTPKGPIAADLWIPNDNRKSHGAVIMTIGVEVDRKDARVIFLANNIARLGVAVLVPEVPGLAKGRFLKDDSDYLVASFKYLETLPNIKKDKIGFLAYCGSSVIAMLAAQNPKINNQVSYIAVNNLFYDTYTIYKAGVEKMLIDSKNQAVSWQMNPKTVQIMNREFVELIQNENDKKILTPYLVNQPESVLAVRQFPQIPATVSAKLTADGKRVHELLTNHDPSKSQELLDRLPENIKFTIENINTAVPRIADLKAPIYVMADRGNTFQPFTDSYRVVKLMPKNQYTFLETSLLKDSFLVEDLDFRQAISEGIKIFLFTTSLLIKAS